MLSWLYMLFFVLLIPLAMIIVGQIYRKRPPKRINNVHGYRTPMSMSSQDAWDFAHRYFGKLWLAFGIILLILSVVAMLFVIGLDNDTVAHTGTAVTYAQLFIMVIPIIPTEIALKKNFDKNGDRKL